MMNFVPSKMAFLADGAFGIGDGVYTGAGVGCGIATGAGVGCVT